MSKNAEMFEGIEKLPLPLFITDENGKIIYKNKFSEKYFNIRKGCNILRFTDEKAMETISAAAHCGNCAIVPLRNNEIFGLSIVIPKKGDGDKTEYIYSLVPYSYDFIECQSESIGELSQLGEYYDCFESQISIIKDAVNNETSYDFSEAYSLMRVTLMKLKRLETRLQSRAAEMSVYTGANKGIYFDRSINLCSFISPFLNIFNSLCGVVGCSVTYIPTEPYSICRANSSKLSELLVYLLMYCIKFSACGDVSVSVKNETAGSCIILVPKDDFQTESVISRLDFSYLSTMAASQDFKLELGKTDDGRKCIVLSIERKIGTALSLSASDDIFDVSTAYIEQIFRRALSILG